MISTITSVLQRFNPAYLAAVALIAIQVGMGVLFKAVQHGGQYTFSISAAITISEFFKFCLSSIFFYRTCWDRHRKPNIQYQQVAVEEPLAGEAGKSGAADSKEATEEQGASTSDKEFTRISFDDIQQPSWAVEPFTPLVYLNYLRNELNMRTVFGYGQLALLYATINNTVFVLFKLADPGTIQLIKSGITLVTALVLMFTLGTKIARLQWVAIGLQICGLIVTQYHPGTGSTYPLPTYCVLFFQTFVSAVAGVYNQHLLKSQDSSLHAQNMVLYAYGVLTNSIIHTVISSIKPEEPGMLEGFGHIGAIFVIVSNVLNGLAITAVYKYADAIVKCFATAISTGILLYVSPLLFNVNFSFLVLPGTVVVFTATWLYMDAAPPKAQPGAQGPAANLPEQPREPRSNVRRLLEAFTPSGILAVFGLSIAASVAISGIAGLNLWDTKSTSHEPPSTIPNTAASSISPFKNTMGVVRYNSADRADRFPLLDKYRPFFHTLHYSIPEHGEGGVANEMFVNATLDSWADTRNPYNVTARIMELILNDAESTIDGLLYFHFDLWINPFEFSTMDFNRTWFPDSPDPVYRCFTDPEVGRGWYQFNANNLGYEGPRALARVDPKKYKYDPRTICEGWSDMYYIPRRFFADFIELSTVLYPVFHESIIPLMLYIIDKTYRTDTEASLIQKIGDCWGNCCANNPTAYDIEFRRCGHRMDYRQMTVPQIHYDRLDRQAILLGNDSQIQGRSLPLHQSMRRGWMEAAPQELSFW